MTNISKDPDIPKLPTVPVYRNIKELTKPVYIPLEDVLLSLVRGVLPEGTPYKDDPALWRNEVERLRSLPEDQYKAQRDWMPCFCPGIDKDGNPTGIVVVDDDKFVDGKLRLLDIDPRYILYRGKSLGGKAYFTLIKIPPPESPAHHTAILKAILRTSEAPKNQSEITRRRFLSPDPAARNLNFESLVLDLKIPPPPPQPEVPPYEGEVTYSLPKLDIFAPVGQWRYPDLVAYVTLCNKLAVDPAMLVKVLELNRGILYHSRNEGWEEDPEKFVFKIYDKYRDDFGSKKADTLNIDDYGLPPIPDPVPPDKPKDPPPPEDLSEETYFAPDEIIADLLHASALSPFIPLKVKWNNEYRHVTNSFMLIGPSASGKSALSKTVDAMMKFAVWMTDKPEWGSEREEIPKDGGRKKKVRLDHMVPVVDTASSEAAVLGSVARYRAMLLYATEMSSLKNSMGAAYNGQYASTIKRMLENEPVSKITKNPLGSTGTKGMVDEPKMAVMLSGTVSDFRQIAHSTSIEEGLVSRFMVVELPAADIDKPRRIPVMQDVRTLLQFEDMETFGGYTFAQCKEVIYDYAFCISLVKTLLEEFEGGQDITSLVMRGVRDLVKRVGVLKFLRRHRYGLPLRDVEIDNTEIMKYVPTLMASIQLILDASQTKIDRFGKDITLQTTEQNFAVAAGKLSIINGAPMSLDQLLQVKKIYLANDCKLRATARYFGKDKKQVQRWLQRLRELGHL